MSELKAIYSDRRKEVLSYIELLEKIDKAIQSGKASIYGARDDEISTISQDHIKMLHSMLFLYLYNIIEWSLSNFVNGVQNFIKAGQITPNELPLNIFKLWVANIVCADKSLSYEKRVEFSSALYYKGYYKEKLDNSFKFQESLFKKNIDLQEIKNLLDKFGVELKLSEKCRKEIHKPVMNGDNVLCNIKSFRNKLAHGELSFCEASTSFDLKTLREWAFITIAFTDELVDTLDKYIFELEKIKDNKKAALRK